jgi:hypothetical protein
MIKGSDITEHLKRRQREKQVQDLLEASDPRASESTVALMAHETHGHLRHGEPKKPLRPPKDGEQGRRAQSRGSGSGNGKPRRARQKGGLGRPLKGSELRKLISARIEPTQMAEMRAWTGKSAAQLLEAMHELCKMAKTGAEGSAIVEKLGSIMEAT